jgi:hypothetical protein
MVMVWMVRFVLFYYYPPWTIFLFHSYFSWTIQSGTHHHYGDGSTLPPVYFENPACAFDTLGMQKKQ